ncbi:hypothetical protein DFP72DRAFT_1138486 [Ephemerocybe angulata]|uniref:Uncharacterized protein n=1 Tax=Ephemerocybe angulata TaxID=980116 RepID=A0A8H6HSI0_9AGAR|nr:hypothetical protein DFP72DRAFT_1138486 [Tulosesus angulatus]
MELTTASKASTSVSNSKKPGVTEAKRQSKKRAAAASRSKTKKGNGTSLAISAKATGPRKQDIYITDPALRKMVLENDPRCRVIDPRHVSCIPCKTPITLEANYYLSAWFRHVGKTASHQRHEKEWAERTGIDRAGLLTEAPMLCDLPAEWTNMVIDATEELPGESTGPVLAQVGEETNAPGREAEEVINTVEEPRTESQIMIVVSWGMRAWSLLVLRQRRILHFGFVYLPLSYV